MIYLYAGCATSITRPPNNNTLKQILFTLVIWKEVQCEKTLVIKVLRAISEEHYSTVSL